VVAVSSTIAGRDRRHGVPTALDLARQMQIFLAYPADPNLDNEPAPPSAGLQPDWSNPEEAMMPVGSTAADAIACTGLLLGAVSPARAQGGARESKESPSEDGIAVTGSRNKQPDPASVGALIAAYESEAGVRGQSKNALALSATRSRRRRGYTTAWLPTGAGDGFARVDAVRVYD